MSNQQDRVSETRQLSELRLHDFYSRLPAPSDDEVNAKTKELQAKRRTEPLEVIDGIVIHGRDLFLAAQSLGLKKVKVISREDYRDMDQALIGLHIIDHIFDRAESDLFDLARLFGRWLDWKSGLRRRQMSPDSRETLRDQIAALLQQIGNCDRRTLERHRDALFLPESILSALRNKILPMSVCSRLCQLSLETQCVIADLIRQGIPPQEAVDRFLPRRITGPKQASTALQEIIRATRRGLALLEDDGRSVGVLDDDEVDTLRRLGDVLKKKIRNNASARRRRARLTADIQDDLDGNANSAA